MKLHSIIAAAALLTGMSATTCAAAGAITTATVNLRAGPGTNYPVMVAVPQGQPIAVSGCISGYAWCDVAWGAYRGWVSSGYIRYAGASVGPAPAPVIVYRAPAPVSGGWADARRDARVSRRVNNRWDHWTGH